MTKSTMYQVTVWGGSDPPCRLPRGGLAKGLLQDVGLFRSQAKQGLENMHLVTAFRVLRIQAIPAEFVISDNSPLATRELHGLISPSSRGKV